MKETTTVRKPLLCLDTNASIDLGVIHGLRRKGESLDAQGRKVDEAIFYDETMKADVAKRHRQLQGAVLFLNMAQDESCLRLPRFAKIEHERVRSDRNSIPPFPVERITPDAHCVSLEIFSETTLGLADSLIFASAMEMQADAIVSTTTTSGRRSAGARAPSRCGKPASPSSCWTIASPRSSRRRNHRPCIP